MSHQQKIQQVLDQHAAEFDEFDRLQEQFNFHSSREYSQPWRGARDHRAGIEDFLICMGRVGKTSDESKRMNKLGIELGITNFKGKVHSHISNVAAACRKLDDAQHQNWLENTHLKCEDGTVLDMVQVAKTAHQKAAKLCAILTGLDKYARRRGLIPAAVTITLPPRFHANPGNGNNTWNGSTPRDGHNYLKNSWANFGRRNGKILGFRAVESQEDGTEHWHMLFYVNDVEKFKSEILKHFNTESEHQIKFDVLDSGKAKKASSYVMKYAFKTIGKDFEGVDRPVDHEKHWRYLWNIRGYQFSGLPRGALTIWDEMRRIKKPTFGGCALYAHAAADTGDFCEFLEQLTQAEENGQQIELAKSRRPSGTTKIEGLIIGAAKIATHTKTWTRVTVKSSIKSESGELRTINQDRTGAPAPVCVYVRDTPNYTPPSPTNWPPDRRRGEQIEAKQKNRRPTRRELVRSLTRYVQPQPCRVLLAAPPLIGD